MIDRAAFIPDGSNPPWPVVLRPNCTVPTQGMAEILAGLLDTDGEVYEIGTGSGYQTAVIAERCRLVVTIEIDPIPDVELKLPQNVVVIHGDGFTHDTESQYDAVLVTCTSQCVWSVWVKQMKEGAKLVVPIGDVGGCAAVCVYQKIDGKLRFIDIPCYAPFTARERT
jgi:protein-L-isoaspartate O-methyltransferase